MSVQNESEPQFPSPVAPAPSRLQNIDQAVRFLSSSAFSAACLTAKSLWNYSWSLVTPLPSEAERLRRYEEKCAGMQKQFQDAFSQGKKVEMGGKAISHLFRPREQTAAKLNMQHLNQVISVDAENQIAHVEGMTSFYDLVEATLKHGLVPKVVPELGGITVGGAIAGAAVESSSFKHGLFHFSVKEMEVLTGKGERVICSPDNEQSDLFYGMPNSYGTLGYILSAKVELVPAKPYVNLAYHTFDNPEAFFAKLQESCNDPEEHDFVDGAIFAEDKCVLVLGKFADHAEEVSDYRPGGIYYKEIQQKKLDTLTTADYLWRWDTDAFWGTEIGGKPTFLQNPTFRRLFGRALFRSDRLIRLSRFRQEFVKNVIRPFSPSNTQWENMTQDVGIPIQHCAEFVRWFQQEIGILPIFVCPFRDPNETENFPLLTLNNGELSCDIGFFNSKKTEFDPKEGHYNRIVEEKVASLEGKKALYSRSFYPPEVFHATFGGDAYDLLKPKYDPDGHFPTLYEKTVQNR